MHSEHQPKEILAVFPPHSESVSEHNRAYPGSFANLHAHSYTP